MYIYLSHRLKYSLDYYIIGKQIMSRCQNFNHTVNGDLSCGLETCKTKNKCEAKSHKAHLVWKGTDKDTECEKFKRYVQNKYGLQFESDRDFHRWSVDSFKDYWESVWCYFDIEASKPHKEVFVKTGPGFLDTDWFTEAKFNIAENLLRIRDDTVALLCEDEEGNTDRVTFAEMYEEVKLYAAAFRKHGLQKGDGVACHMSNRKEAIFAMLATLSVGGLWGGVIPFLGAKSAANIVSIMEPKFLIAVDRHQDNGIEFNILSNLPTIIENAETLEKVIIVPTKDNKSQKYISHVKNSCFLQDFLESGKMNNNTVPDLVFEQLPASHPVFLSFTSGTTGIAKGAVHSARVLLHSLANVNFIYDLKQGDVMFCNFPMGWIPILSFIGAFKLGVTMFLYCGNMYYERKSRTIWDMISEHNISFILFIPSQLDKMEKIELNPKPTSSYESLKVLAIGCCPVKVQNVKYISQHLPENTFVGNLYGATEWFGFVSGFYYRLPGYAGEIQLPLLGIDIKSFNDDGLPVVGELGTAVITSPSPCFPLYLWKDTDNSIIEKNYLSRFPGVWFQSDMCWINPETQGIVIKGRSDDTFVQNGDRFGPGDIYFAIHHLEELEDYICVAQNRSDGDQRVVLFLKLKSGHDLTPSLVKKIEETILEVLFEDCLPKLIKAVRDIPYNLNNKRMESIIRKILATNKVPETVNIKNPECLKDYCDIPEIMNYYNFK